MVGVVLMRVSNGQSGRTVGVPDPDGFPDCIMDGQALLAAILAKLLLLVRYPGQESETISHSGKQLPGFDPVSGRHLVIQPMPCVGVAVKFRQESFWIKVGGPVIGSPILPALEHGHRADEFVIEDERAVLVEIVDVPGVVALEGLKAM